MLKELLYFSNLPPLFILVIMEDTLRAFFYFHMKKTPSLNPCFNGRYSQRNHYQNEHFKDNSS